MAGSLIKIDEEIVTSAVASVTLTGIDSTYDVYMVKVNNWKTDTNNRQCLARVTESGTPNTTANYDYAGKGLRSDTTFTNRSGTNGTEFKFEYIGTADSQAQSNLTLFLFNFNSTTEYAFITNEMSNLDYLGNAFGTQGGQVFTSTGTARDGMQFFMSSSANTSAGKFTLFGLKK